MQLDRLNITKDSSHWFKGFISLNIIIGVGHLDIVNNNNYYKSLIDIPADAERLISELPKS